MIKKITALVLFCAVFVYTSVAQEMPQVEMADGLRQEGKFYVVIFVMAIIFCGVALYLFGLDRRIRKLEKQNK